MPNVQIVPKMPLRNRQRVTNMREEGDWVLREGVGGSVISRDATAAEGFMCRSKT